MPLEVRAERLANLTAAQRERLFYRWSFWARPSQLAPDAFDSGALPFWLILAGRGFGKTRTGAEKVREWIRRGFRYVNLLGPTADDVSQAMVEGESGILAVCPDAERPRHVGRRLLWPNGAVSLLFSAEEPDRLRNKQHEKIWCDEIAAWRYPEAWDQAQFGLRLGREPQAILTTTPRPTPLVKGLIADARTVVTRGTTYENRANLAPGFIAGIVSKYEGTRLGRQEINAEVLDDNPDALWTRATIDAARVAKAPELARVVVGVDPVVTSSEDADEAGIVVVGRGPAPEGWTGVEGAHFYVVGDASLRGSPNVWARAAVKAYHDAAADRLVAEINNGGEMVELTIRAVDPNVAYKAVTASRGKLIRAEPVAALYEQGRVHHVGAFGVLEDQLCDWSPLYSPRSPDRLDALVWGVTELMEERNTAILDFYRNAAAGASVAQTGPASVSVTAPGLAFEQLRSAFDNGERHA